MDQIAVMGLKALAKYKEALDKAKEQVEVARNLSRRIEIFEVTITMIPSRGDKEQIKKMVEAVPGQEFINKTASSQSTPESSNVDKVRNYASEAENMIVSSATNAVQSQVMNMVSASPLGKYSIHLLFRYTLT